MIDLKGDPGTRALEQARRDPIIKNLLTKQPDEIIAYWQGATTAERMDLMGRIVLLVAGLARGVDFD